MVVAFLALITAASAAQAKETPPAKAPATKSAPQKAPRRIEIAVTEHGFEPGDIKVGKGEEITLVFTRKTDKTCAKEVVIQTDSDKKITKELPLNTAVEVTVKFARSGEFSYACGMGMYESVISVQ